jgi:hypothetical protein
MVVAVIALLFLPRLGRAHTPGLSTAEFDVSPGGPVEARLTFASAEPLGGTALRDEDLRAFVLKGVDVTADGTRCDATYRGASVDETDGLRLEAIYDCPAGAREIGVVLYYLSTLRSGHREVARIVGPPGSNATVEQVLSGDRRALQLELPATPGAASADAKRDRLARRLVVLSAVFAAVMVSLFVWRWRATRKS